MTEKKKNTDRTLFEKGGDRAKNHMFETDSGVSWQERQKSPGKEVIRGGASGGLSGVIPGQAEAQKSPTGSAGREPLNQNPTEFMDADGLLQLMIAGQERQKSPGKEVIRGGASGGLSGVIPGRAEAQRSVIRGGASGALTGALSGKSEEQNLLEKLLGGSDPYGSNQSIHSIRPQVPESSGKPEAGEGIEDQTRGEEGMIADTVADGYIEALQSILNPNYAAQASEDVMGQYAAMTGGRPSSAAISAGTAAKAETEAALLRELLAGGADGDGDSKSVLGKLLGENTTIADVPEEYAGYADLEGYETIVPMLESFESEEDMGDYLADMVNKGFISEAVATEYLKRFDDPYEEYDAEGRIDYASMVKNLGGWTLTDDGGTNFFGGLNRNMKIKSPNGQEFTVAQLYRLLKKNGMDEQEAKDHLVKLQNYLKSKE